MDPQVNVELDIEDVASLPNRKVTVKLDPTRTDYDQLIDDLVDQLKDQYTADLKDKDLPCRLTCFLHFHRIVSGIVQKLKVETYEALY